MPQQSRERQICLVFYCHLEPQWEPSHDGENLGWLGLKVLISFHRPRSLTLLCLSAVCHTKMTSHPFPFACQSTPVSGTMGCYTCDAFLLKQLFWKSNHVMLHWVLPQVSDSTQPAVDSATVLLWKHKSVQFPKGLGTCLFWDYSKRLVRNYFKMAMTLDSWFQVKTNASLIEPMSKLWSNLFMCPGMFLQPIRNGLSRLPRGTSISTKFTHCLPWFRGRKDSTAVCNPACQHSFGTIAATLKLYCTNILTKHLMDWHGRKCKQVRVNQSSMSLVLVSRRRVGPTWRVME